MSVLGTEVRLRRWGWASGGCAGLAVLTALTKHVELPLPMALRLIGAPEVLALIAVVVCTYPLLERLPQFSPTAVRDRALRPLRVVVSLLLMVAVPAPGAAAIPHLLGFGLGLWAVTVVAIVAGSDTLAWMVPVIGGMGVFIADGDVGAPVSTAIATPAASASIGIFVLLSAVGYALGGPRPAGSAHA